MNAVLKKLANFDCRNGTFDLSDYNSQQFLYIQDAASIAEAYNARPLCRTPRHSQPFRSN
jgi:hypothetical protein